MEIKTIKAKVVRNKFEKLPPNRKEVTNYPILNNVDSRLNLMAQ